MSGTLVPTAGRLAGIASFAIDGTAYQLAGELEYSPSTIERETLKGQDAVHGYKEMPTQGWIKAKLRDSSGITVADFNAMTSVEVLIVLANGKSVSGTNMWCVAAQEVETQEATFEVRFEGVFVGEST